MKQSNLQKAASQFGNGIPEIESLGQGLIHRTFKVSFSGNSKPVVLQCINERTFSLPENIIHNYHLVDEYLQQQPNAVKIPGLVPTHQNKFFWIDDDEKFWRATTLIPDSCSLPVPENKENAFCAARCFAQLTSSLIGINTSRLNIIIPRFHDLEFRYKQFEEAVSKGSIMRLLRSTHVISELRDRNELVDFYRKLVDETDYPTRVMHHDCKISNILFHKDTKEVLCPVDLDTLMPGKYFSDIGDMIRSMACTVDENSTAWEKISIHSDYYGAIISGYLDGIGNILTDKEKENLHYSGLIMIYMQAVRFVADFLNNDIYYKTEYPEQNLNRALNQLILLEKLEEFLQNTYSFTAYNKNSRNK